MENTDTKEVWTRCAPADLFYRRDRNNSMLMFGTERLNTLVSRFKKELLERGEISRKSQPSYERPAPKHRHGKGSCSRNCKEQGGHSSDSDSSDEDDDNDSIADVIEEMERKMKHPARLHQELWFNDPGEMNDGPLCRCR